MEEVNAEKKSLEAELMKVMKEKVELEASAVRAAGMKGQVDDWKSTVNDLEKQVVNLSQELEQKTSELTKLQDDFRAMQADNQSLKTANLELNNQLVMKDDDDEEGLGGLGGSPFQGGGLDFASRMEEKETIMRLEQEVTDLKLELAAAQAEGDSSVSSGIPLADLEALNSELKALKSELIEAQANFEAESRKTAEAESKCQEFVSEAEMSKKEVARLKEQLTKAVNVATMLKAKVKDKDEQLVNQAHMRGSDAEDSAKAQARVSELEAALSERDAEVAQSAGRVAEAEALSSNLKAQTEALQAQNHQLQDQVRASESSLKAVLEQQPLEQLPTGMDGSKLAIQQMQNQLHEKDKQLENLKNTLEESTKLKDSEIKLVSTAFYEIGLEVQQRWRAPPQGRSWLSVHRQRLQKDRAPFGPK